MTSRQTCLRLLILQRCDCDFRDHIDLVWVVIARFGRRLCTATRPRSDQCTFNNCGEQMSHFHGPCGKKLARLTIWTNKPYMRGASWIGRGNVPNPGGVAHAHKLLPGSSSEYDVCDTDPLVRHVTYKRFSIGFESWNR